MIKKLCAFIAFLLCINLSFSQVVSIGSGTQTDNGLPIDAYFGYSYSQCIYLASEVNQSGDIYRITYKGDPGSSISSSDEWVVYIGHTTLTEFTPNVWVSTTEMTQVFSGSVALVNNKVEITLDVPFNYNGTDNLIIAIDENAPGYNGATDDFLSSDVSGARSIIYRNDSNNPDPANISENTISQNAIANVDLDFNAVPCEAPTGLSVSNVLSNSASFSWTQVASESSWNVQYGIAGFTLGEETVYTVNNTSYDASGLSPATDYEFYVQSDCGDGASAWSGPYAFTTDCVAYTVMPFSEDFETITSGQPTCWGIDGTTTTSTYHWYSSALGYSGRGIRFSSAYNSLGNTSELTTPVLDLTSLSVPQLKFYFMNEEGGDFEVLVSTDAGINFTSLESGLVGYADWTLKSYDLSSYRDSDVVIKFKGTSNYDFSSYIYLDNVLVQETPSCEAPSNLLVSDVYATSALLGWTNGASEVSWEIEYEESGFTQGTGEVVTATTNPFEITNLSPETTYEFYVRANCGAEYSACTGPYEFTTLCQAYTIPFFEGFENGYIDGAVINACVSQESVSGSDDWTANNFYGSYNREPRTGDWNAFLRYSNENWLFVPITLTSGQSYTVSLYARQDGSNEANASVGISYGAEATAASMVNQILQPTGIVNGDYQKLSGNFVPASSGVFYVGIKGDVNGLPWYISIDDISIDLSPNCVSPNNLSVTNITDQGATLGWVSLGSESLWDIEYGEDGFTQGEGTVVSDINTNEYNVSDLEAITVYDFYVRANCGSEYSEWFGPFSFTTICGEFTAPYSQNFDQISAPEVDPCWSTAIVDETSSYAAVETTTFNEFSPSNSLKFQNSSDNDGDYYLISPKFSDLDNLKRVKFQVYKNFNGDEDSGVFELGVMTDASNYNTFTSVYTFDVANFDEDDWKQVFVGLNTYTGGEGHIVFKYQPGTSDYKVLYLDDFVYEVAPTEVPECASNLQAVSNDVACGNSGAEFLWDSVANADGYRLTIGTVSGGSDILDNQDLGTATSYSLATTMVSTNYYWSVTPYNTLGDSETCVESMLTTSENGCYCNPSSTSTSTYIDSFTTTNAYENIANINSGYATDGYIDNYETLSVEVSEGSFGFSLDLVGGTAGCAIWIDWNNDFVFNDENELMYETTGYTNGPISATVTLPNNVLNGDYRMRVIVDYNDATPGDDACGFNGVRGEAEDYKVIVNNTLGVNDVSGVSALTYYPNPVNDVLALKSQNVINTIEVYNTIGQKVIRKMNASQSYQLDMSGLNSGIYFVKVSGDKASKTIRIIKN